MHYNVMVATWMVDVFAKTDRLSKHKDWNLMHKNSKYIYIFKRLGITG